MVCSRALPSWVTHSLADGVRRRHAARPSSGSAERSSSPARVSWRTSVLRGLCAFAQNYLGESAAQGGSYQLRRALYAHVQQLSFSLECFK